MLFVVSDYASIHPYQTKEAALGDWYLGEIRLFSHNTIPAGWKRCEGQILKVAENQALAALIGSAYGGDGRTTFALPDLRGRVPVDRDGRYRDYASPGVAGGQEAVTLTLDQVPPHNHQVNCFTTNGDAALPTGCFPAAVAPNSTAGTPPPPPIYAQPASGQAMVEFNAAMVGATGGGIGHENRQPTLAMVFCIATNGIWPPRAD